MASILDESDQLPLLSLNRDQGNLLFAQPDLKGVTRLEVHLGGVGTAHDQISVELNTGLIAGETASLAGAGGRAEVNALCIEQSFVERREVQALNTVFPGAHIASGTDEFGLGGVPHFLDQGEQLAPRDGGGFDSLGSGGNGHGWLVGS